MDPATLLGVRASNPRGVAMGAGSPRGITPGPVELPVGLRAPDEDTRRATAGDGRLPRFRVRTLAQLRFMGETRDRD